LSSIEEVEIEKETDKFVIFKNLNWRGKPHRDAKRTSYRNYFKTKPEAVNFLLEEIQYEINKKQEVITDLTAGILKLQNEKIKLKQDAEKEGLI
jgi:hypothetical protein